MFHLIPAPWHRMALRVAHRVRSWWRRTIKPQLYGVTVVAGDGYGKILLVRHSYGGPGWSFPGGGCGRGEDPAEAAQREMREELGCEVGELALAGTLDGTISGAPHKAFIFSGVLLGDPQPDGREIIEARYFATDELPPDLTHEARVRYEIWQGVIAG